MDGAISGNNQNKSINLKRLNDILTDRISSSNSKAKRERSQSMDILNGDTLKDKNYL